MKNYTKNKIKWFSFTVPALIFYLSFSIIPSLAAVFYSFTEWNGLTSRFIGLENYIRLFTDSMILNSFKNAAIYAFFITVFQNTFGLLLAIVLDKKIKGSGIVKMLFFMPAVFSSLVLGYIWGFILQPNFGALNVFLGKLGLEFLQLDWLGNPQIAIWVIILVSIWQFSGYSMVIFLAGLKSIPDVYYEAAHIDGASSWAKFRFVTFPLIAPSFTINILLSIIGTLKIFDQIYSLTGGGPYYQTESLASMIYTVGFKFGTQWGYGTALSVVMFIFISAISFTSSKYLRNREVAF